MSITATALIKLPLRVFDALPRSGAQPEDGSFRVRGPGETTVALRYLQDAAFVETPLPFGEDDESLTDLLWDVLGDDLADHDDDRGIFVLPSVARPRGHTYELVVDEVGEVGEWVSFGEDDEVEGGEDEVEGGEEDAVAGEVESAAAAPSGDLMAAVSNITRALGPDALQSLQQAMLSGNMGAFARAQERIAQEVSQRPELARQLQGLMGMMPPDMLQAAMSSSPEEMMRRVQGSLDKGTIGKTPKGGR